MKVLATDTSGLIGSEAVRPGDVYNRGLTSSASILECIAQIDALPGIGTKHRYLDEPSGANHICYISDFAKFKTHSLGWKLEWLQKRTIRKMAAGT